MMSVKLGRKLQNDYPEITDDFRSGLFFKEIAKKYDILGRYNIRSERIASNAVMYAIKGYDGRIKGIDPYEGLISDQSELESLLNDNRRRAGQMTLEMGLGIFNRRNKDANTLAKGLIPWTRQEIYDAKRKAGSTRYNHRSIADYLNDRYHGGEQVRTQNSVKLKVTRDRK